MIIDFHTHMFPDKIAGRTLDYLSGIFGASPFADGTYTGLCNSMGKGAVDISIALPAVTKVSQVASINRFASAYTEGPVISFGGIHPECENYKEILKEIKNLGLKGIKLHPDYQDMYFDNIRYERIIDAASELGLITVVHAGVDPKCPEDVHCTPEMARKVLDDVKPEKLVLAHMGGNEMWDDVERYLVGQNVYFDTGVILNTMPPGTVLTDRTYAWCRQDSVWNRFSVGRSEEFCGVVRAYATDRGREGCHLFRKCKEIAGNIADRSKKRRLQNVDDTKNVKK